METVKVSWSGGKDSTCAVMKHIEAGHHVKAVCYIPMFTDKIPLILKKHYAFIVATAELFRSLGAEVWIVHGMTYYDWVLHRSSRGKYKGRMFGFPLFQRGKCGFKRDSKEKALRTCNVGFYDYEDVGIAFDETDRQGQLSDSKRSILCELQITEADAKEYDRENGILSPHYELLKRDGCALCPNAPPRERDMWFSDYPEAIPFVLELQEAVRQNRPEQYPLRGRKMFIEQERMNDNAEIL